MSLALRARGLTSLLRIGSAGRCRCQNVAAKVECMLAPLFTSVRMCMQFLSLVRPTRLVCLGLQASLSPFLRSQRRPLSGQPLRQSSQLAAGLRQAREDAAFSVSATCFSVSATLIKTAAYKVSDDICLDSVAVAQPQDGPAHAHRYRRWQWQRRLLSRNRRMRRQSRCTASSSCAINSWQSTTPRSSPTSTRRQVSLSLDAHMQPEA